MMALQGAAGLGGVVLSDGLHPPKEITRLMEKAELPVILASGDCYQIASRVHSMTVKTLPSDYPKIARIQEEIGSRLDVKRILEKLGSG